MSKTMKKKKKAGRDNWGVLTAYLPANLVEKVTEDAKQGLTTRSNVLRCIIADYYRRKEEKVLRRRSSASPTKKAETTTV